MKTKIFFLTFLLFSIFTYSQTDLDTRVSEGKEEAIYNGKHNNYYSKESYIIVDNIEKESFKKLSIPSEESKISAFLKRYLTPQDLKKVNYSNIKSSFLFNANPYMRKNYDYTIRLTFEISSNNQIWNQRIKTGNTELDKKIKKIFRYVSLDKLGITSKNRIGKNIIQLFAREGKKTIIKASTNVICETKPAFKKCTSLKTYQKRSSCLYKTLYQYIIENISSVAILKQRKRGEIKIEPRFTIDSKGNIINANSLAPNKVIKKEIDRILKTLDQKIIPAERNGTPISYYYKTTYILIIEKPKKH